jgi:hypothetical protein
MIKKIDLKTACDVIYRFADANHVDSLRAIELMVSCYNQLAQHEKQSLTIFMEETKN